MHKKAILIIIFVCILAFGNSLTFNFVGDDNIVIVKNHFYESWSNFPSIFSSEYIMDSDAAFNAHENASFTGSVAYRPVLSTSYFIDHWLWGKNPFGYHLHNVTLHIINAILVYFIVFNIFKIQKFAFFASLLFVVHPLKSEAVCSIGYRADLLSCLFVLSAFLCYIKHFELKQFKKNIIFVLAHVFFLLAIFAKESAAVFPGLIIGFDFLIKKQKLSEFIKGIFTRYVGFIFVLLFYIYIYLWVFPNKADDNVELLGRGLASHIIYIMHIFCEYIYSFINPMSVKTLPPAYSPVYKSVWNLSSLSAVLAVILIIYYLIRLISRSEKSSYFLLWFLLSYIPASNLMPLVNPMAHRYMYLPSVGLIIFLAFILEKAGGYFKRFSQVRSLGSVIKITIISLCILITIHINLSWKNNFLSAYAMVKEYPENPMGHNFLGIEYYKLGYINLAKEELEKSISLGIEDPRPYNMLGIIYINDFDKATTYFEKNIKNYPNFGLSYIGLGRIYLFKKDYNKALPILEKGVELAPKYSSYGYLIQTYILLGEIDKARELFKSANNYIKETKYLNSLNRMLKPGEEMNFPVDIGI